MKKSKLVREVSEAVNRCVVKEIRMKQKGMKQTEQQAIGADTCNGMGMGDINLIPNISDDNLDAVAEYIAKDIVNLSRRGPLDEADVLERVKGPIYAMVNRSRN